MGWLREISTREPITSDIQTFIHTISKNKTLLLWPFVSTLADTFPSGHGGQDGHGGHGVGHATQTAQRGVGGHGGHDRH